jgi:hypothetical protein
MRPAKLWQGVGEDAELIHAVELGVFFFLVRTGRALVLVSYAAKLRKRFGQALNGLLGALIACG